MRDEIRTACKFLRDLLRLGNLLSDNELEVFRRTMEDVMKLHYQQHWFPEKPTKGSGYRCIRINHKLDPLVAKAARHCGMFDYDLLKTLFPNELTLWVDPREVSYRIGENGSICVLYDGSVSPSSEVLDRYRSCKDSMRGTMIMEPRNHLEQMTTAYVSG
jgi:protein Tob/BTG